MNYRFSKEVEGIVMTKNPFTIRDTTLSVFVTSDTRGSALSIIEEATGLMYSIPVNAIKKELKKIGV